MKTSTKIQPRFVIMFLTVMLALLRFIDIAHSPPGFYCDESAGAAHAVCLAQTGHDVWGHSWPLFSPVLGEGFATWPFLVGSASWIHIFGASITALRAFSAFFGCLAIFAIWLLASALWDEEAAWIAALAAALSPWLFVFSRIYWDPAVMPAFLMLGWYFFVKRRSFFAAFFLALALYSYPPTRAQVPLAFAAYVLIWRKNIRFQHLLLTLLYITLFTFPLIVATLDGALQGRFQMLSISAQGHTAFQTALIFLHNMALHFSPRFLFISGDANLRHSIQRGGEWSWIDTAAAIYIACTLLRRPARAKLLDQTKNIWLFCILSYLAGIVPASLTWESLPHALRSLGAAPFLSLLVAGAWSHFIKQKPQVKEQALWSLTSLAVLFSLFYFGSYFGTYPQNAKPWFDESVVKVIQRDPRILTNRAFSASYHELSLDYFRMTLGHETCAQRYPVPFAEAVQQK